MPPGLGLGTQEESSITDQGATDEQQGTEQWCAQASVCAIKTETDGDILDFW